MKQESPAIPVKVSGESVNQYWRYGTPSGIHIDWVCYHSVCEVIDHSLSGHFSIAVDHFDQQVHTLDKLDVDRGAGSPLR